MLAIVLGYTAKGGTAPPTVLYAGRDASEADAHSLNPPAGTLRTELIKHPVVQRTRHFDPIAEPAQEIAAAAPEEPPAPETPPAPEEPPALEEAAPEEAAAEPELPVTPKKK